MENSDERVNTGAFGDPKKLSLRGRGYSTIHE